MTCWLMVSVFMIGSAMMGYLIAWFLQPIQEEPTQQTPNPVGGGGDGKKSKEAAEKAQKALEKMQKRYDELYDSKLDVDTALVAVESTLDGLKMDYERLERDMSNHNNRHQNLQKDFNQYKDKKEDEIRSLKLKTKQAVDNYENAKFQLAKSNRINEKLQESLVQLKGDNEKLSTELEEAREEIEVVNASMAELKTDYDEIKGKAETYNEKLAAWQEKYSNLDLNYQQSQSEREGLSKAYEDYQISAASEIDKLSDHLKSLQSQLEESTNYANEYASAYTDLEKKQQEKDRELELQRAEAAKELAEIQKHLKGLEADYDAIQQREQLLDDRFASLQDKHTDLEEAYLTTVEEKENLEQAYQEYKKNTKEEFYELEKNANQWFNKLEASNVELAQHKEKAAELEANKQHLANELERTRKRYEKELSLSGGEFDALNDTFETLKERYFDLNKELSSTKLEKEKIDHEHETLQEQMIAEMQLIRGENKKLTKSLAEMRAQKRLLEYSKEELLERIEELEANAVEVTPDQGKLIKIINRLRDNLKTQEEQFKVSEERYQKKIEKLERKLQKRQQNGTTASQETAAFTEIEGITNGVQDTLYDLGIYNFKRLANLSDEEKSLLCQVLAEDEVVVKAWMKKAQSLV